MNKIFAAALMATGPLYFYVTSSLFHVNVLAQQNRVMGIVFLLAVGMGILQKMNKMQATIAAPSAVFAAAGTVMLFLGGSWVIGVASTAATLLLLLYVSDFGYPRSVNAIEHPVLHLGATTISLTMPALVLLSAGLGANPGFGFLSVVLGVVALFMSPDDRLPDEQLGAAAR
ncbi:MAG: hypothetical protein WDN10_02810 [bacterium]